MGRKSHLQNAHQRLEIFDRATRYRSGTVWIIGTVVFIIYLVTLYPSVPGGDAGELITVAFSGGVVHPPGYPLFTMLAKLFSFLPVGSVAWRINLLSAIAGASAICLLYDCILRWTGQLWPALLGAGLFAFSPLIWTYSTSAEVFALNNLIVACLVWLSILFAETRQIRFIYLMTLAAGLGISNHHTSIFFSFPLVCWAVAIDHNRILRIRPLLAMALFFISGLMPYLYLPVAAHFCTSRTWGDTATWSGFLTHVTRQEYGTFQLSNPVANKALGITFLPLTMRWVWDLLKETLFFGAPLGFWGAYISTRKNQPSQRAGFAIVLALSTATYLIFFNSLCNLPYQDDFFLGVITRFWQQSLLVFCFWIGIGAADITRRVATQAASVICIALVALQAGIHFGGQYQGGNTAVRDYGRAILQALPQKAILLVRGDLITNSVFYVQTCEGLRPDVRIVELEPMTYKWYLKKPPRWLSDVRFPGTFYNPNEAGGFSIGAFLTANISSSPIFLAGDFVAGDSSHEGQFELLAAGMVSEVVPKSLNLELSEVEARTAGGFTAMEANISPKELSRFTARPESWELRILHDYWHAYLNRAAKEISMAMSHGNDPGILRKAIDELEDLIARDLSPSPYCFKNLGLAYSRLIGLDPLAKAKMIEYWDKYVRLAKNPDPDLPAIELELSR